MGSTITKHPAGAGLRWLVEGWRLFAKSWGVFIGIMLVMLILMIGANFIPILGQLAVSLFGPVLAGGFFYACNRLTNDQPIGIGDLFAAFRSGAPTGPLIGLGALSLVFYLIVFVLMFFASSSMMVAMDALQAGSPDAAAMVPPAVVSPMMLFVSLAVLTLTALWYAAMAFAIPEIAFNGQGPVQALGRSLKASLRNWLPLLIFGLLSFLAMMIGLMVTFGLGILVIGPWTGAALYCAWRDIFLSPVSTDSSVVQV
ncbi:BPSS1780 family membrane protein [Granulosicoccaceae sp. 1_MG-2023]|nr:BPSS1780 family membrane protein [Granulosicoccaceae sp. 1_MG-2023]